MLAICSWDVFWNLKVRVLSSAMRVNLIKSEHLGKSLIKIKNDRGLSIES